jgi:hypothetical protein
MHNALVEAKHKTGIQPGAKDATCMHLERECPHPPKRTSALRKINGLLRVDSVSSQRRPSPAIERGTT